MKTTTTLKMSMLTFVCMALSFISTANITSWSISSTSATTCDSLTVSLAGTHTCPNDYVTNISHSVVGSDIIINVSVSAGICIPPIPAPSWTDSYTFHLGSITPSSYTVKANYMTIPALTTQSLQLSTCCPAQSMAGPDTTFCDQNSLQLFANAPSAGMTATWNVITGTGTLNSPLQPSATISNLSYGVNEVVWTVTDTSAGCSSMDTVVIVNDEMPTAAVTEVDRHSCTDTTTLKANALMVGSGKWMSHGSVNQLYTPNAANCLAVMIKPGLKKFSWTTTNGLCISSDTLKIDYIQYADTPIINLSGGLLTSTAAPAYQWYLDGNPISGANAATFNPTTNGEYQVFASETTCNSGLFSNTIEISAVGVEELAGENLRLYPNPAQNELFVEGLPQDGIFTYQIYNNLGERADRNSGRLENQQLDVSFLDPGLYYLLISGEAGTYRVRFVKE